MTAPAVDFRQAVLPHLDAAYALARWLVRDPALAEDVTQEATLRALGYFASFRGGDARAWFLRIVRNEAYDVIAARRRAPSEAPGEDLVDPAPDPEAALTQREGQDRLHAALAALPIELRECLVLRELEGMSYKEIAAVAGVPIGTVMSRLWRARQAMLQGGAA